MSFSLGNFAGGAVKGYQQQNDELRKQKAQDRIDKDNAEKDAMNAELKASEVGLANAKSANAQVYKNQTAARDSAIEMSRISPDARLGAASAVSALGTPPALPPLGSADVGLAQAKDARASVLRTAPGTPERNAAMDQYGASQVSNSTFASDMTRRSTEGLGSAIAKPAQAVVEAPKTSIMGGLGSVDAVSKELAKPADVYIPPKPSKSEDTVFDYLNHLTERVAIKAKYGQVDEAAQLQLHHAMSKIKSEGVVDALKMLNAGQDEEAMKHFQSVGDHRGEKVLSSVAGEYSVGGVKVPTRIVTMEGVDGHHYEINTAQAMLATQTAGEQLSSAQKSAELAIHKDHYERSDKNSEDKAKMYYEFGNAKLAARGTGGGLSDTTADVKNMEYYKKLSPEDRAAFDKLKGRSDSTRGEILVSELKKDFPFDGAKTTAEKAAYMDDMVNLANNKPAQATIKPSATTTPEADAAAFAWAKGNPNDPRAAKILKKLGGNPAPVNPAAVTPQAQKSSPPPAPKFQYPAQAAKRNIRDIQNDLNGLQEYPSYVNPEVKAAQAVKRQQLIRELEEATGLPSARGQQPLGLGMAFRNGAR